MYRVLVVDDEKAIRDNISYAVPFNDLGFEVVGTAKHGKEAMEKLGILKPDLILLDVNMPVMNGLDFLKWLRMSEYKSIKVIMLSGYNDFEFARKAIRYKAKAYMTKPVDEEECMTILEDLRQELDREKAQKEEIAINRHKEYYNRLYTGGFDNRELLKDYSILYFVALDHAANGETTIEKVMHDSFSLGKYEQVRNRGSILTYLVERKSLLELNATFETCGKKLVCRLKKEGVNTAVLIDKDIFSIQRGSFREDCSAHLYQMLTKCFYSKDIYVEWCKERERSSYCDFKSKKILLEGLKRNILSLDFQKVLEDFEDVVSEMQATNYSIEYVYEIGYRLYYLLIDILSDISPEDVEHLIDLPQWQKLQVFEDFEGWKQRELKDLRSVFLAVDSHREKAHNNTYKDIIHYVHCNYNKPISIKAVANHFHMNPVYVGRVLKQSLGVSMKSYVNTLRIEEAKKLLVNSDKMIYEIAMEVGFSESKYFVSKFTESIGISPLQYRKGKKLCSSY